MNEWTFFGDQLPPFNTRVLLYDAKNESFVLGELEVFPNGIAILDRNSGSVFRIIDPNGCIANAYWMLLVPPEGT